MVLIVTEKSQVTFCCCSLSFIFYVFSVFGISSKLCTGCSKNVGRFVFRLHSLFLSALGIFHFIVIMCSVFRMGSISSISALSTARNAEKSAHSIDRNGMKTGKPTNKNGQQHCNACTLRTAQTAREFIEIQVGNVSALRTWLFFACFLLNFSFQAPTNILHKTRLLQFRLHGNLQQTHTHTQWMRRGPHYLWFYYRLNFRVEYTVCCVFLFFLFFDTFCCVHPISNVCGCGGAAPSRRLKRFARTLLNCSAKRMLAFISKWIQRTNIENLTMKMSQIRACTELMFLLWLKNELLHGFSWNARYTFTIYTKCIFSVCVCACDSCWNRAHKQSTRTAESQR